MEYIRIFLSENFQFLAVIFSIYLNRRVYVMGAAVYGDIVEADNQQCKR